MFERFTERARKVVVLAQDEARHFNHNYIGTEHLLLGLLREDEGVAAQALTSLGLTLDRARQQVESIVGYGAEDENMQAPFTPLAKKSLEMALRAALQLGHNYVGTEHIILGLLQVPEGTALRVLSGLEVDADDVRPPVMRRITRGRTRTRRATPEPREAETVKAPPGFTLRRALQGHQDNIRAIAWSPDGGIIALPSSEATIRVWIPSRDRITQTLKGHIGTVNSVAWSPDGQTLASGADDSTVRLWDLAKGRASRTFQGDGYAVTSIAWSPENLSIALVVSDGTVRLWNTATGQVTVLGKHEGWVNSVAWSPDGQTLASGADDSTVRLWDVEQSTLSTTLQGHSSAVLDIAWSPDGSMIASVAQAPDSSIRIWNTASGSQSNVLEGHVKGIMSVSFSNDGRLLASKSYDNTVLLWRTDTWVPVAKLHEPADPDGWGSLAFSPTSPHVLATLGEDDRTARIWELDVARLLDHSEGEAVRYTSAKAVLVGESNVGKSSLAMRLATGNSPEEEGMETTHGMQLWRLKPEQLDPSTATPRDEQRSIVLWDMGGQDEYRLVHQLFLRDTALALVFLDPTRGRTAFEDVEAWNKRLQKQLGERSVVKLLVGSKMDKPSELVDHSTLAQLVEKCNFTKYFETSAFTGRGVEELGKAINQYIDWASATKASRLEHFQHIRDEIARRRDRGEIVLPLRHLIRSIRGTGSDDKYDASTITRVAEQLATQGLIAETRLVTGERTLVLRIEEIERYAGSLIVAARNNPHGVPALEERALASLSLSLPGIGAEDRLPRYQEMVILECVAELLIQHGICFRHEGLLIFPTLFPDTEESTEEKLPHSVSLYYDFTGAIDNIYASLVAQLVISREFGNHRLEANHVEFDEPGKGVCGVRQIKRTGGLAHIDLFFGEDTEQERRNFFINFVEDHLRREGVEVREHQAIKCRGCGREISQDIVQENVARGQKDIVCPYCRTSTLISEGVKTIREREEEDNLSVIALRTDLLRSSIKERQSKDAEEAKRTISSGSKKLSINKQQPIRILHLSDLHFTGATSPRAKLQWLVNDLKNGTFLGFDNLEYVVVSGDMTDKGREEGFDQAREFMSLLIKEFKLSAQRCIFVPGNHDVPDQLDVYRIALPEEAEGLDARSCVWKDDIVLIRDESKYPNRLRKFSEAFYHKVVQRGYPLEYDKQGIAHLFPDTGIQFLTLNSCWEIDRFNRKRASIHHDALAHLLQQANEQIEATTERHELEQGAKVLRLGVWHHSVMGPESMENIDFIVHLQNSGVQVCLHGDVHEMRRNLVGYWLNERTHIVGAGSFGSPAEGRPESIPRLYNVLEIKRDLSSIRVHTRSQRSPDGPWQGWYEWPANGGNGRVPYYDIHLGSIDA